MRVFIITEAGKDIGFGHITRCAALSHAFYESSIKTCFIIKSDDTISGLLDNKEVLIFDWLLNEERLFSIVKGADIIVIHSYIIEPSLYKELSGLTKTSIYLDDNNRIKYPPGIVLNGAIYTDTLLYDKDLNHTYLLGARYALVRKEFWDVKDKEIRHDMQTIMVTFGGNDSKGITPKILEKLNRDYPFLKKYVIIGRAFTNIKSIENQKASNVTLVYYPDAAKLKSIMLDSDLAISAGGQTLYELARVGLPAIVISVAENQLNNVYAWQKAGFIKYAGDYQDNSTLDKASSLIRDFRVAKARLNSSRVGRSLVDGQGSRLVVEFCKNSQN